MEEINNKLYELIDTIKENKKVIRMIDLKNEIYKDEDISNTLDMFHKEMNNPYSDKYISLKKKILDNEKVNEYKSLENELFMVVLDINKSLKNLIDRKKCSNESN